jgi:hypothetical protein
MRLFCEWLNGFFVWLSRTPLAALEFFVWLSRT